MFSSKASFHSYINLKATIQKVANQITTNVPTILSVATITVTMGNANPILHMVSICNNQEMWKHRTWLFLYYNLREKAIAWNSYFNHNLGVPQNILPEFETCRNRNGYPLGRCAAGQECLGRIFRRPNLEEPRMEEDEMLEWICISKERCWFLCFEGKLILI